MPALAVSKAALTKVRIRLLPVYVSTPRLTDATPAALGRVQDQMSQHRVERDGQASVDPAAAKQQRDSVLSGAAGVTGEDLGVAENQRLV